MVDVQIQLVNGIGRDPDIHIGFHHREEGNTSKSGLFAKDREHLTQIDVGRCLRFSYHALSGFRLHTFDGLINELIVENLPDRVLFG